MILRTTCSSLRAVCFVADSSVLSFPPLAQEQDITVKAGHSPEVVAEQWGCLRDLFSREDTTLIAHLTNHYALVREAETGASPLCSRHWFRPKGGNGSS